MAVFLGLEHSAAPRLVQQQQRSVPDLCATHRPPDTLSLIDVLVAQQNPASFPEIPFLSVLQLRLQQRRTREQLADQGIMPREYLFLPFSPTRGSEGLCSSWVRWGTVWHQLPAQTHSALSRLLLRELCFLPCRDIMVPGAIQWCPVFATQIIMLLLN